MAQVHHVQCDVVESESLGRIHHRLLLRSPRLAVAARPGQFVHCAPGHPQESLALLRRPLSISDVVAEQGEGSKECLELIFRTTGPGTRMLANRQPKEKIDCLGPLGNGFTLTPDAISVVIAGGMGLVPLRWVARELAEMGSEVHLLVGTRSQADFPFRVSKDSGRTFLADLEADSIHTEVAVEEEGGGLVTHLLAERLPSLLTTGKAVHAYAVGPKAMLKPLVAVLPDEVPCQVSLEERMACGVGACRSCVVALKHPSPPGYVYRRVCRDGPVFDLREIVWEAEKEIG